MCDYLAVRGRRKHQFRKTTPNQKRLSLIKPSFLDNRKSTYVELAIWFRNTTLASAHQGYQ